ncbi:DinB family protein [Bacillus sp. DX1.1]|uniref:DinB family protein n=1 Tax=unclassified Bacillus (in: firmicutes) TaxID=185979 RepID=UPI0025709594|nr:MULTISPECIES: DinB family protein [unclassified Bacillus (in: firmicutes)]MDM5155679.1 DinB family protein [Bacillus sp. DX1.1]WJE79982.1 DinB family protein [Bacillus sp. DX3.1]
MSTLVLQLESTIDTASKRIKLLSDIDTRPQPSKWSKKEILGHLCDSGTVNHKRFVNILTSKESITITGYNQELWVQAHNYQRSFSSDEILQLWQSINKQIIKLLTNVKDAQWQLPCKTEEQNIVTFEWLVTDYIDHMDHHLKQIFADY